MKNILFLALGLFVAHTMSAQHICGTSHAAQQEAVNNILEYRKNPLVSVRNNEVAYIPFTVHRVGKTNGKGKVSPVRIIEQFQSMQKDYAPGNLVPYIKQITEINDSDIYSKVGTNAVKVNAKKDPSSANLFVTQNANVDGSLGTVLGFYNPSYDYLVVKINEMKKTGSTLPHEFGHFLSLPHTFYGWETEPYDFAKHGNPVMQAYAPAYQALVELVDKSNCDVAADAICDTPPDYNFGLGAPSCTFTRIVKDRNGDTIRPMVNNFMGYFLSCESYEFTPQQITVMRNNLASSKRDYLRSNYVPDTSTIGEYNILTDVASLEQYYDKVFIDWEDAENATHYAVTVSPIFGDVQHFILEESELTLTNLDKDDTHIVRIVAYHEGIGQSPTKEIQFKTSKTSVGTIDPSIVEDIYVYPNPAVGRDAIYLYVSSTRSFDGQWKLFDMQGKEMSSKNMFIHSGDNTVEIDTQELPSGIYFLEVNTAYGTAQRKVSIR